MILEFKEKSFFFVKEMIFFLFYKLVKMNFDFIKLIYIYIYIYIYL